MWQAGDSEIDRAIDRVAEQLTAGDASPLVRARVLERLDRQAPAWRSMWLVSPLAAAVVIIVAVFAARGWRTDVVDRAPQVSTARNVPPPVAIQAPPPRNEPSAQRPDRPAATLTSNGGPRRRDMPPERPMSEVEALAPPALDVESIVLDEMAPAGSIRLPQLEPIAPLTVAPIADSQGERP